ncbi:hypothetical protein EV193_102369 [Herbihabitans rhizosphaerae]|uniref:Prenyltransferase/squalene oxidase-like repeat protein n=1 Tax=Herbihabitans rhizosphaerae TaxID=1872711 RepID=A0A4Q7L3R1_9PSEU|nr:prenyltransferase [Herbihabitans rhizosphaerae]RZS43390.1 hypothetical protein EV193_102369 [Herbihabitans rhizosphaerae]
MNADHTAAVIAACQLPDGAIPWTPGGITDPWNHIEAAMGLDAADRHAEAEAAYDWLAARQNPDGSWYAEYREGLVADLAKDTNFTAYIAVGVLHHALSTHDSAFLERLWPAVSAAMEFVLRVRRPDRTVPWRLRADGTTTPETLVPGNCSVQHALRCAVRIADLLGLHRPEWTLAAKCLREAIASRAADFTPKPHAMDWYYPVLTGVLAADHLDGDWNRFVVPGLGVRCVHHEPWVTGGETAELAIALAVRGDRRADELLADLESLRHHDGSYWTGYQFRDQEFWPHGERTTWTAGAVLLAHAATAGDQSTVEVFAPQA